MRKLMLCDSEIKEDVMQLKQDFSNNSKLCTNSHFSYRQTNIFKKQMTEHTKILSNHSSYCFVLS